MILFWPIENWNSLETMKSHGRSSGTSKLLRLIRAIEDHFEQLKTIIGHLGLLESILDHLALIGVMVALCGKLEPL